MSKTVVWLRKQKGGNRQVTPLLVTVVARTPSGDFVVERMRGFRKVRETVSAKNIRPLHREAA